MPDTAGAEAQEPRASAGVHRQMASGALWLLVGNGISRALGFVSLVILVRILQPEDFGLTAMAVSVYALLEAMSGFGFNAPLIQNQRAGRAEYNTVWTLSALRGVGMAALLMLLAAPAARFWGDSRIEGLVFLYAAVAALTGFVNVGVVDFFKLLQFRAQFSYALIARTTGFAVTVGCAIWLQNYWAIALGALAQSGASLALSFILHPYRPRFSLAERAAIWRYSSWVFVRNIFSYIGRRADRILLGRISGMDTAGVYDVALEVANLPTVEFVEIINQALFPGFSKLAQDRDRLRETYADSVAIVLALAVPAGTGIALVAEPLVHVILTDKFAAAVKVLQVLAIAGIFQVGLGNFQAVYNALGVPRRAALYFMIHTPVRVPLLVAGILAMGLEGAAWGMFVSSLFGFVLAAIMVRRHIGIRLGDILIRTWRALAAALAMVVVVLAFQALGPWAGTDTNATMHLFASVVVGVAVYTSVSGALWILSGRPVGPETFVAGWWRQRRRADHGS